MKPYWDLQGFEQLYLEDSYVWGVEETSEAFILRMLLVLREGHAEWRPPLPNQQYCYRDGQIRFEHPTDVDWVERTFEATTNLDGSVDYGNVHAIEADGQMFRIYADFGQVRLRAEGVKALLDPP